MSMRQTMQSRDTKPVARGRAWDQLALFEVVDSSGLPAAQPRPAQPRQAQPRPGRLARVVDTGQLTLFDLVELSGEPGRERSGAHGRGGGSHGR